MNDADLDLSIEQLSRALGDQLNSVDGLSTKVSVVLGFTVTSFATLFGLNRDLLAAHAFAVWTSAALLATSAIILAASYSMTTYHDSPDPAWLLGVLNRGDALRPKLAESLAGAYILNRQTITRHFRAFNLAIALFVAGVLVFVIGVWFP